MSMKKPFTWCAALAMTLSAPALAQKVAVKGQVSIEADVEAAGKQEAAAGDKAFAAGDYRSALASYGEGFSETKDPDFLYAMGQAHKALGNKAEAKSLFESYLAGAGELKYRSEAAAEAGLKSAKNEGKGMAGKVTGAVGGATGAVTGAVGGVAASVYTAAKVQVADRLEAGAKAAAQKGDQAYAAGNYAEARAAYDQAYAQGQHHMALFAEGMSAAHAGKAAEARGALAGYLSTQPKGEQADQARQMLVALGGSSEWMKNVAVGNKVSKEAKNEATQGDNAFKAGRFMDAARFYGEAYAKKSDSAALYAKGMAQFAEGNAKEASQTFKSYLASGGKLEFKPQAEAALKASLSVDE